MENKIITIFLLSLMTLTLNAESIQTLEGKIYREGTDKRDLMYIQKEYIEFDIENGLKTITHSYYDPQGIEVAREWVQIENGEVKVYGNQFNRIDTFGLLSKEGNNYNMIFYDGKKTKDKNLALPYSWVAGPLLASHISENLQDILEGEKIEFHLPFFDRLTTVPFIFSLKEDFPEKGLAIVDFKLKNFLLGLLIDTIEFVVDRDTGRVLEIHGPTVLPDPLNPDNKGQVDANIYYTYPTLAYP